MTGIRAYSDFMARLRAYEAWWCLACLGLLSLVIRLPFFFVDVIDWDESTYILMGQAMLDGREPRGWLVRAYPYALFILGFGRRLEGIRLAGAAGVALTAFFAFRTGRCLWGARAGWWAGILTVLQLSLTPGGQATLSEHVALVPLLASLRLLVSPAPVPGRLFLAGMLAAMAALVRLNLGVVASLAGLHLLLVGAGGQRRGPIRGWAAFVAGGVLTVAASVVPYAWTGQTRLWWTTNVAAGWAYAHAQMSVPEVVAFYREDFRARVFHPDLPDGGLGALVLMAALAGVGLGLAGWKTSPPCVARGFGLILVFLSGTAVSLLVGGAAYSHYLLQAQPFLALLAGLALGRPRRLGVRVGVGLLALAVALAASLPPVIAGYRRTWHAYLRTGDWHRGAGYEIASFLRARLAPQSGVYLMEQHIAYWFLGLLPPTPSTVHPSNLAKPHLLRHLAGPEATVSSELARILDGAPAYIVKPRVVFYLEDEPEARQLLERTLDRDYRLVRRIGILEIHQRR